jgi:hypothetical protein
MPAVMSHHHVCPSAYTGTSRGLTQRYQLDFSDSGRPREGAGDGARAPRRRVAMAFNGSQAFDRRFDDRRFVSEGRSSGVTSSLLVRSLSVSSKRQMWHR